MEVRCQVGAFCKYHSESWSQAWGFCDLLDLLYIPSFKTLYLIILQILKKCFFLLWDPKFFIINLFWIPPYVHFFYNYFAFSRSLKFILWMLEIIDSMTAFIMYITLYNSLSSHAYPLLVWLLLRVKFWAHRVYRFSPLIYDTWVILKRYSNYISTIRMWKFLLL